MVTGDMIAIDVYAVWDGTYLEALQVCDDHKKGTSWFVSLNSLCARTISSWMFAACSNHVGVFVNRFKMKVASRNDAEPLNNR